MVAVCLDTLQPFSQIDSEQLADECFTNATCKDTQTHALCSSTFHLHVIILMQQHFSSAVM